MKRKLTSFILAMLFIFAAFPALILTVSAAEDTLTNLYEFDGEGTPNATTAGGAFVPNANYTAGKNISVTTGDKIYVAPALKDQVYHIMSYGSGATGTQVKIDTSDVTYTTIIENTNIISICYTVPEGVTSITPTVSQNFVDIFMMTKNKEFTYDEYKTYFSNKQIDVTKYLGGAVSEASALTNVFATGGVYEGRTSGTGFTASTSYFCTKGMIEAKGGDIIYFIGNTAQGYHLSLFNQSGAATTTVKKEYMMVYDFINSDYAIYAYRLRNDTTSLRVVTSSALYNASVTLATINQPFDDTVYRAWCKLQNASPDALIGSIGSTPAAEIVNIYDNTKSVAGYAAADGFKTSDSMVYSEALSVEAGDTIYVGPENKIFTQPIIVAYDSTGAKAELKAADLVKQLTLDSGFIVYNYTIPAGITSIRINAEKLYSKYLLITKNQLFDRFVYDEWYASGIADGNDLWNPTTAIYGGYASVTAALTASATYDCTAYIPVKPGDKIYVAALHNIQPTLGVIYNSDFKAISNLSKTNFTEEFMISDSVGMLCYTVPANIAYVRFIPRAKLTPYTYITKNIPISRNDYIAKFNISIPDASTDSILKDKTALFVGDSITFGAGEDGTFWFSWPGRIGKLTGMKVINNGDSGARVSLTGTSGFIKDALTSAGKIDADLIVMHGGVNDARYNIPLGSITGEGKTTFDTTTFSGGLENMFNIAKIVYPKADLFFISNFHLDGHSTGSAKDMSKYFNLAEQICEKWGVTFIDLYNNTELNTKLATTTNKYLPDYLHPNGEGYDIITPYIIADLEKFYAPEPPETTELEVTTNDPAEVTSGEPETQVQPDDTTTVAEETTSCGSCSGSSTSIALLITVLASIACFALIKKRY